MPIGIGTLLGLGALSGVVGAGASFGSQAWSQSFNKDEAQKARDFAQNENILNREFNANQAELNREFNANQAQISRDWAKEMESTKYQRARSDMEKAGINPASLSGSNIVGGSASGATATGTAASMSSSAAGSPASSTPIHVNNLLSNALSGAIAATIKENKHDFTSNVLNNVSKVLNTDKK